MHAIVKPDTEQKTNQLYPEGKLLLISTKIKLISSYVSSKDCDMRSAKTGLTVSASIDAATEHIGKKLRAYVIPQVLSVQVNDVPIRTRIR